MAKSAFRQALEEAIEQRHSAVHPWSEAWTSGKLDRRLLGGAEPVVGITGEGDVAHEGRDLFAALPGGNGLRIDWALFANYRPALPWGLAGGLDPCNVAEAIQTTSTPLVDVSSGVESAPGVKDAALIAAFCQAARGE